MDILQYVLVVRNHGMLNRRAIPAFVRLLVDVEGDPPSLEPAEKGGEESPRALLVLQLVVRMVVFQTQ